MQFGESLTGEGIEYWDRHHVWHAFTQMAEYQPLIIERATGAWLETDKGERLLDGVSSMWCNLHGHRHPAIDQAIADQLAKVAHVTNLGMSNPTTIELSRKLVEFTPPGLECVFFSCDGSSAIEAALKMAVQFWQQCADPEPQRTKFLAVGSAYHGDTLGSVSVGGLGRFRDTFAPLLFDVLRGPCPDSFRTPGNASLSQACEVYAREYASLIEQYAGEIAAVIVEPLIQCAAGMVMHPPGFLRRLREITERHNILLIADEIAVGMGRTGRMWASQWEDVVPDILCIGKGLSGGYLPMSATITCRHVWDAFLGDYAQSRTFFHGHTYGGNPLGSAACLATLQIFEREQTLGRIPALANRLAEGLKPLVDHPHVGDIRQRGLMAAVELVQDRTNKTRYPWTERRGALACEAARRHGVWLRPLGDVLPIIPPLCITDGEIDLLAQAVTEGVYAATQG